MTKEQGFTLVELLVVIAIIGILASLSVQIFHEYKDRAYVAVAEQTMLDTRRALEAGLIEEENLPNFVSVSFSTPGLVNSASGLQLTPGLVLNSDSSIYADYLRCNGSALCLESYVRVINCNASEYLVFSRYGDGREISNRYAYAGGWGGC